MIFLWGKFRMGTEEKFRKLKHTVYLSGLAVILYGFWGIIKVFMSQVTGEDAFGLEYIDFDEEYMFFEKLVFYTAVVAVTLAILLFHYYVGRNAMLVGKYNSKKRLFLIPAILMTIYYIICIPETITDMMKDMIDLDTDLVSFLIDLGFIVLMVEMIVSIFRIKYFEEKLRSKGN